ncbi:MAG: glycosyltransferase family 39 protein [Minisyncoccota bacterium]
MDMFSNHTDKYKKILLGLLLLVIISVILFLKPVVAGDGITYRDSISFIQTGDKTTDFSPNRLLTTVGGLYVIIFLSKIFGSVLSAWFFMNAVLYVLLVYVFYKIIFILHKDKRVALVSSLFLAFNYGLISFGVNFLMDIGGWFFYVLSLYFTLNYSWSHERKYILLASSAVGIGLLFKEYAVLGVIPVAVFLVYENFRSVSDMVKKSIIPALFALVPSLLLYLYIYIKFDYTYLDWINTNAERYGNINRVVQYIKCFGSLLNLLIITCIGGLYQIWKERMIIEKRILIFIVASIVSFLPLFLWPGITQRVLFVSVPAIIILSSFFIKRYIQYKWVWVFILLLYFVINFTMDSFILSFINLPI